MLPVNRVCSTRIWSRVSPLLGASQRELAQSYPHLCPPQAIALLYILVPFCTFWYFLVLFGTFLSLIFAHPKLLHCFTFWYIFLLFGTFWFFFWYFSQPHICSQLLVLYMYKFTILELLQLFHVFLQPV